MIVLFPTELYMLWTSGVLPLIFGFFMFLFWCFPFWALTRFFRKRYILETTTIYVLQQKQVVGDVLGICVLNLQIV